MKNRLFFNLIRILVCGGIAFYFPLLQAEELSEEEKRKVQIRIQQLESELKMLKAKLNKSSVDLSEEGSQKIDVFRIADTLVVTLSGVPKEDEWEKPLKIDEKGNISMPYIGNVKAVGLTSVQLKDKIEKLYKFKRYYTTPNITINSIEDRFISVNGEVRNSKRLIYTKDMTILGAIAECGGFTDWADRKKIKILRGSQVIYFNATDATKNPEIDIPLLPDDKIHIKRSIW